MPATSVEGPEIHVDPAGFLTEVGEWDDALAERLAAGIGLVLTDEHWNVLSFAREEYLAQGAVPALDRVATAAGTTVDTLARMFPGATATTIGHLAGLPRPLDTG